MIKSFHDFGISDKVLVTLSEIGFEEPTQIQKIAIPPALAGHDIIGQAQTGTGKTAAFAIPIIEKRNDSFSKNPYAIVLAPTRELAIQVSEEINRIAAKTHIRSLPIYGGQSIELQIKSLRKGINIIVGTPGRVIDHIDRRTLSLDDIQIVVLDEADEMLNMGFIEDIETILSNVPTQRQTMLFSATMPHAVLSISKKYMKNPIVLNVDTGKMVVASKVKQVFYEVRHEDKIKALTRLLDVEGASLTLIFCHTKREVDDVSGKLLQMGYPAGAIHGDFTQNHREDMIRRFKKGEIDILVATDVAARGLDIPDVSHVINYSIPQDPEGYVHRVGRTGRAGKSGIAITFVTPREYRQLRLIEQSAKTKIKREKLPTLQQVKQAKIEELESAIIDSIAQSKDSELYPVAHRLLQQFPPEQILVTVLSMLLGWDEIEEISDASIHTPYISADRAKDIVRLFMNIGKKDNIKVADIVKSISAEAGIPAKKIGNIALMDKFSFIEVPADLADRVILAINDSILKGKKVMVQHAKKKK